MPLVALKHKTRRGLPLWLEITVVLVLKILLLWWAKTLWFDQPLARHMTVPAAAVERQLLGTAPAAPTSSPVYGENHATRH